MTARGLDGNWIYEGVWGILVGALRVPREAPALPVAPGDELIKFHPARGFLRYLKLHFWIGVIVFDGAVLIGMAALIIADSRSIVLTPLALLLMLGPNIVSYIGLHLLYDTTWYVMTQRSLRIRTGILVLNEMTITFENVQNVTVNQGPIQRIFGIADVVVDTAGGGVVQGPHGAVPNSMHSGTIRGVDNAESIRALIRERLSLSRTAGLGDDIHADECDSRPSSRVEQVNTLREIRDLLVQQR